MEETTMKRIVLALTLVFGLVGGSFLADSAEAGHRHRRHYHGGCGYGGYYGGGYGGYGGGYYGGYYGGGYGGWGHRHHAGYRGWGGGWGGYGW
jgi:hypothetical protein